MWPSHPWKTFERCFWVMSILEGTCAKKYAEKINEDGLKKLDNLHQKLERHCEEKDHEKYMAVNHKYHTLVQELAGSKVLTEVINGLDKKSCFIGTARSINPTDSKFPCRNIVNSTKHSEEKIPQRQRG